MSPVRKTNTRTVVIAVATFAIGAIGVLVLFLVAVGKTSESGSITVKLGDDTFNAGDAAERAQAIDSGGPILFSDVAGGQRDIFLQHQGGDVKAGWLAFDVRPTGQGRDCVLQWDQTAKAFKDPCDGTTFPPDGGTLRHYPATVDDDGDVIVDLNPDKNRPTTTTAPPETSTTSTIKITNG